MKSSLFSLSLVTSFLLAPLAIADPTNIIFIFSDDHAQHAISDYGSKVNQTPNLDRLAIEGRCTDITTDLGIEFLKTRPKDKPFFLMLHQKAPHRIWQPDRHNQALFEDKVIPEPDTLWDDYATRPAALPENLQTIARDLTRSDLKLTPPVELKDP